jgi:hypothetical protein
VLEGKIMEFRDNYHKKELVYNYSHQYFHFIDHANEVSGFFSGDDAEPILAKYDELDIPDFLDWFFNNELDLACNNYNYVEDMKPHKEHEEQIRKQKQEQPKAKIGGIKYV